MKTWNVESGLAKNPILLAAKQLVRPLLVLRRVFAPPSEMSWRLCQRETVCQAFCDHQGGRAERQRAEMSWWSPQSSWIRSGRIPGTITRVSSRSRDYYPSIHSVSGCGSGSVSKVPRSRGSRKGRGFYAQVIMFSTDCFLVLEKLNIVFHNDFAAQLLTMRRLGQWKDFTEHGGPMGSLALRPTLWSVQSPSCEASLGPLLSQGTKQAYQVCLFPYKTRLHYYYCYCVSQTGAKSDPWPVSVHFGAWHDSASPGRHFAGKSAQLLR